MKEKVLFILIIFCCTISMFSKLCSRFLWSNPHIFCFHIIKSIYLGNIWYKIFLRSSFNQNIDSYYKITFHTWIRLYIKQNIHHFTLLMKWDWGYQTKGILFLTMSWPEENTTFRIGHPSSIFIETKRGEETRIETGKNVATFVRPTV